MAADYFKTCLSAHVNTLKWFTLLYKDAFLYLVTFNFSSSHFRSPAQLMP